MDKKQVDDFLNSLRLGPFHALTITVLGLANAADSAALMILTFLLPSLDFTTLQKGVLSGSVFAGMLFGSLLFGLFVDRIGRKLSLILALAMDVFFVVLTALAPTAHGPWPLFLWLLAARVGSGVAVGGSVAPLFTWAVELAPDARRGFVVSGVAFFWMLGSCYGALCALFLLSDHPFGGHAHHDHDGADSRHDSAHLDGADACTTDPNGVGWRFFVVAAAGPSLTACLGALLLPESPRYLADEGRAAQAAQAARRVAGLNLSSWPPPSYPSYANAADSPPSAPDTEEDVETAVQTLEVGYMGRPEPESAWRVLFSRPLVRITALSSLLWFLISFGWYGLSLWIPQLLSIARVEVPLGCIFGVFLIQAANLPGNVASLFLIDWLGRKWVFSLTMAAAFVAALLTAAALPIKGETGGALVLAFSVLFGAVSIGGWNALDCMTSELFPTAQRGLGTAVALACGRLGALASNVAIGGVLELSKGAPYVGVVVVLCVAGCTLLIGAFLSLLLPETKNKKL